MQLKTKHKFIPALKRSIAGFWRRLSAAFAWLDARPFRFCVVQAVALNFLIECLQRRSLLSALVFAVTQPYLFAIGALIILLTLTVSLLLPRRYLWQALLLLIWLGLGVADCILLSYRVTPLAAIDFALLPSVLPILTVYLQPWQLVGIALLFLAALALVIFLGIRVPKRQPDFRRALFGIAFSGACIFGGITLGLYSGVIPTQVGNLADAYQDYGFTYCFSTSVFDRGISKPDTYEEQMTDLVSELDGEQLEGGQDKTGGEDLAPAPADDVAPVLEDDEGAAAVQDQPNVIFLQLESFIDPNNITKYGYSENPCPTFDLLKLRYPSGYLTVPSIGAGTANTEFEVISGMSLQFFGIGEYPYKTVLRDNTCETVAYNLKENGYTATAIHNNAASFYDRDEVFSHLGFDYFISLEYMNNVRYNPLGWACDDVLTSQILDALEATDTPDLIYTISVQGHGKYPDTKLEDDTGTIELYGEDDEILHNRTEYYINQLAEMDDFIAELLQTLSEFEEPVVVVLYGDHLPSLPLTEDDVVSHNLYQTEYVIWSNFELEAEDEDLYAYQLSAHVLELLGMETGHLTKLHQRDSDAYDYLQELELLEYDMLYGERLVWGGENPYEPTDLQLGVLPVELQTVGMQDGGLYVFGKNFTPYSVVCLNGRQQKTVFVNAYVLYVEDVDFPDARSVSVEQVSEEQEVLSETAQLVLQ